MINTSSIMVLGNGAVECELGFSFAGEPEIRLNNTKYLDDAVLRFKNPHAVDSFIGLLQKVKAEFEDSEHQGLSKALNDLRTGKMPGSEYVFDASELDKLDGLGISLEHIAGGIESSYSFPQNDTSGYAFLQNEPTSVPESDEDVDVIAEINSEIDLALETSARVSIPNALQFMQELMEYITSWIDEVTSLEDASDYSVAIRKLNSLSTFVVNSAELSEDQDIDNALASIGDQLGEIQTCLDEPVLAFFTDQYDRAMALLFPDVDAATSPDSLVDLIEVHNLQATKPE